MKIDSEIISNYYRKEITDQTRSLKNRPLLVGFLKDGLDTKDPRSRYAIWTKRTCEKDNIDFELRKFSPNEIEKEINKANNDPKVHGIMVYYPFFSDRSHDSYLMNSISIEKDVEGLCHTYRYNLYNNIRTLNNGHKCLLPCTPLAILKTLEYLKMNNSILDLKKSCVTIVNRSEVVGRPLATMLSNDGTKVFSIDINSIYETKGSEMVSCKISKDEAIQKSNIIITGVPTKDYKLDTSLIQENSVIINVSNFKNVDETELLKIKGVVYVPMIGKMTIAILERNLLRLFTNNSTFT
jgi:methylenetetrahydrofolate dehydrogenase (NAD+)